MSICAAYTQSSACTMIVFVDIFFIYHIRVYFCIFIMSMCTAYTQSSACTMIFFAYLSYSCLFLHIHHVHIAYTQSSACTFFFFWYVFNIFMLIIVYSSYTYALHTFRVVPVCCSFGLFIILMFIIAYLSYPHSLHTLNLVPAPCAFFLASF